MERAGTAIRVAQGLAVLRVPEVAEGGDAAAPDVPDIGTTVLDEGLTEVGRIVDVFGPVARPYLAVSPADGVAPASLLGTVLYAR